MSKRSHLRVRISSTKHKGSIVSYSAKALLCPEFVLTMVILKMNIGDRPRAEKAIGDVRSILQGRAVSF